MKSAARADVFVSSGSSSDGLIILQSGRGQDAAVWLEDTRTDNNGGTFVIKSSGDNRLRVEDADSSLMLAVVDTGSKGDLHVTGDAEFGSLSSAAPTTVTLEAGNQSTLDIVAGAGSGAQISLSGGTALVKLGTQNSTTFAMYTGGSAKSGSGKSLRIGVPRLAEEYRSGNVATDYQDIVSIIDRGTTGDLHVSGNVLIGGNEASILGPKSLTVTSSLASSMLIQSGHFDNSTLHLKCGPGHHSMVVLSQADIVEVGKEALGASFVIQTGNDPATGDSLLQFTDGRASGSAANRMIAILDRGRLGDLHVTGNGIFGDPTAADMMDNQLTVQGSKSSLSVMAGSTASSTILIKSGKDQNAEFRLASHSTSSYAFMNIGVGDTKRLELLHTANRSSVQLIQSILQISDLGSTGQLAFVGDVNIGSSNQSTPVTLDVTSETGHGKAIVELQSGDSYPATLKLTSGANQPSMISFVATQAISSTNNAENRFDVVLNGAINPPTLQFNQGSTKVMSVVNTGALHSARLEYDICYQAEQYVNILTHTPTCPRTHHASCTQYNHA